MAKRKFLVCFPVEGDIKKIDKIADALESEGIDFMQVDGGQAESKMMHTPGRNWGGKKMNYSTVPNITNKEEEDS